MYMKRSTLRRLIMDNFKVLFAIFLSYKVKVTTFSHGLSPITE